MKQLFLLVTLILLSGCELMDVSVRAMQSMENWEPSTSTRSSPVYSDPGQELVKGPSEALISSTTLDGDCKPTNGGRAEQQEDMVIDAGPIKISAICATSRFFGKRWRIASFEFVAEAGHTYTMKATEKGCISLIETTGVDKLIACEPYRRIE